MRGYFVVVGVVRCKHFCGSVEDFANMAQDVVVLVLENYRMILRWFYTVLLEI